LQLIAKSLQPLRNIFLFIRRYLNFLIFLVLQGICIAILVRYNKTHEAYFSGVSLEATGWVDKQYSSVEGYFRLKAENKRLAEENAALRNLLGSNFSGPDTTTIFYLDSIVKDTTNRMRKFTWLPAKVINNSITLQYNYITLERGSGQHVTKGMAVVAPGNTIVGVVVSTSKNYSVVMSLLHRNSKPSCMLKKDKNTGSLEWDGTDPLVLTLKNIPKSSKVVVGDTVLTSQYSSVYPYGLMVGTVSKIDSDPASNFHTLRVRPATNFSAIQHVYLVANLLYAEQKELEEKAEDDQKKIN
jgi:rod shape-determining protein MreC